MIINQCLIIKKWRANYTPRNFFNDMFLPNFHQYFKKKIYL